MKQTEQWASKLGFVLATAGSAIGLGAIWKFPYIAGKSGGGLFLFIFLVFTLLIGLPILLAEFIIGRGSKQNAVDAYRYFRPQTNWHLIGIIGMITCFILLSFYSVVGGWILLYMGETVLGTIQTTGKEEFETLFNTIISSPKHVILSQLTFILITIIVVARGVQNGIEKASKIMMPALFVAFIILIIRSLTLDHVQEGLQFFLYPNFADLRSETILFALGQSFFSISVGVSVMVTYSSYLSKEDNLPKSALTIVLMNVCISILAGLAIFPAVFSFGLEPTEGPGLLFIILPAVFSQMPAGSFFLFIFLLLFLFATLTSAFSMLEIIVAALTKGDKTKRKKTTWIIGIFIFFVGIPSALSFGIFQDITIFGLIIFDAADFLVSNILMPLGALLIAIFVAFFIPKNVLLDEYKKGSTWNKKLFTVWLILLKYVAPIAIVIVFLDAIGLWKLFQ